MGVFILKPKNQTDSFIPNNKIVWLVYTKFFFFFFSRNKFGIFLSEVGGGGLRNVPEEKNFVSMVYKEEFFILFCFGYWRVESTTWPQAFWFSGKIIIFSFLFFFKFSCFIHIFFFFCSTFFFFAFFCYSVPAAPRFTLLTVYRQQGYHNPAYR